MNLDIFENSLFEHLLFFTDVLAYFIGEIFVSFLDFIEFNPFVAFSVSITFVFPFMIYFVKIFIDFSHSAGEMTVREKEGTQNVITKTDKLFLKYRRNLLKKKRDEALEAQRASRGRSPLNNNKYVNAYISSLKYDNK